jgi:hypothetical protein
MRQLLMVAAIAIWPSACYANLSLASNDFPRAEQTTAAPQREAHGDAVSKPASTSAKPRKPRFSTFIRRIRSFSEHCL